MRVDVARELKKLTERVWPDEKVEPMATGR